MDTQICRGCGHDKPLRSFDNKNGTFYDSKAFHLLADQLRNPTKQARRRKLAEFIEGIKKSNKCNKCPEDDFRCLDFHHLGKKLFNVGEAAGRGMSEETVLAEIAKCEILCSNCHRKLTYDNRV
jgi:hypothetical protein